MRVFYDFTNVLDSAVGKEHGLPYPDMEGHFGRGSEILAELRERKKKGELGFANLPSDNEMVFKIKRFVERLPASLDTMLLVGIGGSSLGAEAVQEALVRHSPRTGQRRVLILDNVDPDAVESILRKADPSRTLLNVVTKSGSTAETMANFLVARRWMMTALDEKKLSQQVVVTTSAEKGDLWKIAQKNHFEVFAIPDAVGGRFSVLSAAGLLPSAFSGVNITELILGASSMAPFCEDAAPAKNPAYLSALVQYLLLTTRGKPIQVFFPYSSLLRSFGLWYAQLWAESLGKKKDRNGADVFTGQTPVVAVGTVDQHSQVQLYNEGPNDKSITFVELEKYKADVTIPRDYVSFQSTAYLGGRSLDKLIRAEKQATEYALVKHSRPNATLIMPEVSTRTVGQLFYLLEYQTAIAGELLNINAFDQPGVEDGKEATYALMGRPGYEDLHKAMEKQAPASRCCV